MKTSPAAPDPSSVEGLLASVQQNLRAQSTPILEAQAKLRHQLLSLEAQASAELQNIVQAAAASHSAQMQIWEQKFDTLAALLARRLSPHKLQIGKDGHWPSGSKSYHVPQPEIPKDCFALMADFPGTYPDRVSDKPFDAALNEAQRRLARMRSETKNWRVSILTRATSRGRTVQSERSDHRTYYANEMFRDQRTAVFEDDGYKSLAALLGHGVGFPEAVEFQEERNRIRKTVVINPHACNWSGSVDYDEVCYEHFFRWHFNLPQRFFDPGYNPATDSNIWSFLHDPNYEI